MLYQSVHTVWHHPHLYKCDHEYAIQTIVDEDLQLSGENISENENGCPICEYQFSINDLPTASFISSVIPVYACLHSELTENNINKQACTIKSPRAPPVLFS